MYMNVCVFICDKKTWQSYDRHLGNLDQWESAKGYILFLYYRYNVVIYFKSNMTPDRRLERIW